MGFSTPPPDGFESNVPQVQSKPPDGYITDAPPPSVIRHPIDAFRAYMAQHPAGPSSMTTAQGQAMSDAEAHSGNAVDATVGDAANLYSLYKTPEAIAGLYNLGKAGAGSLMNFIRTPAAAEALAPAENALEAGNTMSVARSAEQAANKATSDALYAKIPKDVQAPLTTSRDTADSIINEIKDLPKSFQSSKIRGLAGDIQNLDKANIGTIQSMNSHLKDIATNGEGIERVYAARLSKAMQTDLENFSKTSVLPPESQAPSLEAEALRSAWGRNAVESSGASPEVVAPYVKPEVFQPVVPKSALTNAGVSSDLNKANSYYRDMSQLNNNPISKALDRAALESKTNVIFKGGRIEDVLGAKAVLGDTGYEAAAGQFYRKLLDSKDLPAAMGKYSPEFLNTAIGPQRVKMLEALAHFKDLVSKAKVAGKVGAGIALGGGVVAGLKKLIP